MAFKIPFFFFFKNTFLYERTLLPLCTDSKHRIFLLLSHTKGLGISFLLLAVKPQILLASEALMLHTACYHFTCKHNFFLLKFPFQNRQLI